MKPLSEQLQDLSQRAKKIEDSAAATRQKNQAELQRRHNSRAQQERRNGPAGARCFSLRSSFFSLMIRV